MENNEQSQAAPESAPVESQESETVESQESELEASSSDLQEENKTPEKKKQEEIKRNIKKLKLKVDGEEFDEEIDLDNEPELIKRLQLAKVSQKRMQESAQLKKQVEQIAKALQESPEDVMRHLGMDPEDWAVKLLQRKLDEDQKSPEQRELEKARKELEDIRKKQKEQEEQRNAQEYERLQREYEDKYQNDIISALGSSGIPTTPYAVKKFAEMMSVALDNNLDVSASDLVPLVKKELEDDIKKYFASSPDEVIEAILGKDRFNSMRKKQVSAMKKQVESVSNVKSTGETSKTKEADKKAVKKISMSDFLR